MVWKICTSFLHDLILVLVSLRRCTTRM